MTVSSWPSVCSRGCLRCELRAIVGMSGVESNRWPRVRGGRAVAMSCRGPRITPAMAQTGTKPPATYPALPSEIPAKFKPVSDSFDYTKRKAMIRMRDGVKLHTVILIPKGAKGAPILLTRTPYSADKLTSHAESSHLGPVLYGYDNALDVILEGGYVRVVQHVRA